MARWLIVFHPKQNIKSEVKRQTCFGTVPSKFSCLSVKEFRRPSREFIQIGLLGYLLPCDTGLF